MLNYDEDGYAYQLAEQSNWLDYDSEDSSWYSDDYECPCPVCTLQDEPTTVLV